MKNGKTGAATGRAGAKSAAWTLVVLPTLLAGCQGDAKPATLDASYYCATSTSNGETRPCDDQVTLLTLSKDSSWTWYRNAGRYRIADDQVDFSVASDRLSGPPTWGLADLGQDTLTFHTYGKDFLWMRASGPDDRFAAVAGSYTCETTTGSDGATVSCNDTASRLVLAKDGDWHLSSWRGQFSVENGDVTFRSAMDYDGPSTWGPAHIGAETLTFHYGTNPTVYRLIAG